MEELEQIQSKLQQTADSLAEIKCPESICIQGIMYAIIGAVAGGVGLGELELAVKQFTIDRIIKLRHVTENKN